jgi:hypothetical protein
MLSSSWFSNLRSAIARARTSKRRMTARRNSLVRSGCLGSCQSQSAPRIIEALEDRCLLSVVGVEGSSVTVSRSFSDVALLNSPTATINWGDGITTPGVLVGNSGGSGTVTGRHVYADDGEYTVTITLADNGAESDSVTFMATIANADECPGDTTY